MTNESLHVLLVIVSLLEQFK